MTWKDTSAAAGTPHKQPATARVAEAAGRPPTAWTVRRAAAPAAMPLQRQHSGKVKRPRAGASRRHRQSSPRRNLARAISVSVLAAAREDAQADDDADDQREGVHHVSFGSGERWSPSAPRRAVGFGRGRLPLPGEAAPVIDAGGGACGSRSLRAASSAAATGPKSRHVAAARSARAAMMARNTMVQFVFLATSAAPALAAMPGTSASGFAMFSATTFDRSLAPVMNGPGSARN